MAEQKTEEALDLGIFGRRARRGVAGGEVVAAFLSALWLAGCTVYFVILGNDLSPTGGAGFVMTLLAVFLPVAIIFLAAAASRSARIMREETVRLQATIDAMRHNYLTLSHAHHAERSPEVEEKIARLEEAQRQTEQALTTFSSTRQLVRAEAAVAPQATATTLPEEQPSLGFEPLPEDALPPLGRDDMIRALHFPENAEDKDGFDALRRALKDRKVAGLVQAAQDVLTLLSQDGIYMDDLRPDRARPEIWRRFAEGQRGREVAALGGIRDRSSLALTAGRMKSDPVFRDATHHFLRRFDEVFLEFENSATDEDIVRLTDTRTARAFMLLGRVTGTFN